MADLVDREAVAATLRNADEAPARYAEQWREAFRPLAEAVVRAAADINAAIAKPAEPRRGAGSEDETVGPGE